MPKVSVIIASFNYARFLKQCLESVLGQTGFSDFEVIFIDDGSTDNTAEAIRDFSDQRLTYIRHKDNLGHIQSFNEGFLKAKGRYLVCVGADDYWHPQFLSSTVPMLERYPEVGLVHTNYYLIDTQNNMGAAYGENIPFKQDFKGNELNFLLMDNYLVASGTMFRREALNIIGGTFADDILYAEDWRLWLGIGKHYEFYFLNRPLVYYRCHNDNLHSRLSRDRLAEKSEMRILEDFFSGPDLPLGLKQKKQLVYCKHYRHWADVYFGFGMRQDARRCLRIALKVSPKILLRANFWKRYLATFFSEQFYAKLKSSCGKIKENIKWISE